MDNPIAIFSDSSLHLVKELLDDGVDPNYCSYSGLTFLHVAVLTHYNNAGVVRLLIDAGANVNARTHLDLTPLHFAVYKRKERVVQELIKFGASINAKDFMGRTCLHLAVSPMLSLGPDPITTPKKARIMNEILKHKDIDVNAVDSNGDTALITAVRNKKRRAVVRLLRKNADPNIGNNFAETPLHVAFALPPYYYIEIELLISGACIYSSNKNGETPIDIFVKNDLPKWDEDYVLIILKMIAFKYSITGELKRKFEIFPRLSFLFNSYCDEVDCMRSDYIYGNITIHDFLWGCFKENGDILPQIQETVVERLIRDIYHQYCFDLCEKIPLSCLFSILEMTACSKRNQGTTILVKDLAYLFSIRDYIGLFSNYLSYYDFFSLLVALSDVKIAKSFKNLRKREYITMLMTSIFKAT